MMVRWWIVALLPSVFYTITLNSFLKDMSEYSLLLFPSPKCWEQIMQEACSRILLAANPAN